MNAALCIGAGPAGVFAAILLRRAFPEARVEVWEQGARQRDSRLGVVLPPEIHAQLESVDRELARRVREHCREWTAIDTHLPNGDVQRCDGFPLTAIERGTLLELLVDHAERLGVRFDWERTFVAGGASDASLDRFDLVIGADGLRSQLREAHRDVFQPQLLSGRCHYAWFELARSLENVTFAFVETPHGLVNVHAHPSGPSVSTVILECPEETWTAAGFDAATPASEVSRTVKSWLQENLTAFDVGTLSPGAEGTWRTFQTLRCERWVHGQRALIGDAAYTSHFSVGSGTRAAFQDAWALVDALASLPAGVPWAEGLTAYAAERQPAVTRLQRAADASRVWFEQSRHEWTARANTPARFVFSLLCRSTRVTYDDVLTASPSLVDGVHREFEAGWSSDFPTAGLQDSAAPIIAPSVIPRPPPPRQRFELKSAPPMFAPYRLRALELANRVVLSPMCQYRAQDGTVNDWHLAHLGARALGGAGLVLTEMTNVSADGRISPGCAGLYADEHVKAWRRVTDFVHRESVARIGVQLAHAGRKASCAVPWAGGAPLGDGGWTTLGPSALAFDEGWHTPREMTSADFARVLSDFEAATARALEAGFDVIELHLAHGYLLSSFLSPLSNRRVDDYGGTFERRMRFPLEVFERVRAAWPEEKPLGVRVSATDWLPDGMSLDDTVILAKELERRGCDFIDVSSAGNVPQSKPVYGRMYQAPFAGYVREHTQMAVMAVGGIETPSHANTVLATGKADLVAVGRAFLRDPSFVLQAASHYGVADVAWPQPYLRGRRDAASVPLRRP